MRVERVIVMAQKEKERKNQEVKGQRGLNCQLIWLSYPSRLNDADTYKWVSKQFEKVVSHSNYHKNLKNNVWGPPKWLALSYLNIYIFKKQSTWTIKVG